MGAVRLSCSVPHLLLRYRPDASLLLMLRYHSDITLLLLRYTIQVICNIMILNILLVCIMLVGFSNCPTHNGDCGRQCRWLCCVFPVLALLFSLAAGA